MKLQRFKMFNIKRIDDKEDNVSKLIFTNETAVAEAVLYKYPDYKTRTVICCSSQSGCPVGCRFCGAGDSFVRSLTAEEIVFQVDHAVSLTDCDPDEMGRLQIMFMSMGEPLLNQKHLCEAIRILHEKYPKAWLLISTSAPDVPIDDIIEVSKEISTVGLQFSIHESTDEKRDLLIPFKKKMDLEKISFTGEKWFHETGRKPFFNYCAHDKNSSPEDVNRLWILFDPNIWCATVSVICERNDGMPTSNEFQRKLATDFGDKLVDVGYDTRVFDPAGQDTIGGGCGQLWFVQDWMDKNPELTKPSVGRDLPTVHVPTEELESV